MNYRDLKHSDVVSRLKYDPETGIVTWIRPLSNVRQPGDRAGTPQGQGYRVISIDGHRVLEHRLVWFYMTGHWPDEIDHINGNRSDNRWANLRDVTTAQNQHNRGKYANNTSGYRGVYWRSDRQRWQAYISIDRKRISIGYFLCKHEAAAARDVYVQKTLGDFACMSTGVNAFGFDLGKTSMSRRSA